MSFSTTSIFLALSILALVTSSVTAEPATNIFIQQHPVTAPEDSMNPDWQLRVVGGGYADRADYPYYVSLGGCGGTLIAPDVVLTAAHCGDLTGSQVAVNLHDNKDFDDAKVKVRYCNKWVEHPDWDVTDFNADFALCKLDRPVEISSLSEHDIELKWNDDENFPVDNEELIVMGHGHIAEGAAGSQILRDAKIKGYAQKDCRSTDMFGGQIADSMICAGMDDGSRDSCSGDSGGPLIKRVQTGDKIVDHLVGVISWGESCGEAMRPGVYARVSWAKDFIRETTCSEDFDSVASWCDNEPKDEPDCELVAKIIVNTDNFAGESSWTLKERKQGNDRIASRNYWINNRKNIHEVCLKKSQCYSLDLYDTYGDASCGNGDCNFVGIGLKGKKLKWKIDNNWGSHYTARFCVTQKGRLKSKPLKEFKA